MKLYFAYGANLNLEGMSYRCPKSKPVKSLYLKDWQLCFSGVATVVPQKGSCVPGALWQITEECEASLDMFEGFPTLYRKETIKIGKDEIMFYVMNRDIPAEPSLGYLMTIAEGYEDWNLRLSDLWDAVRDTQDQVYVDRWGTNGYNQIRNGYYEDNYLLDK
jgi:gamma-glutamylcyclotransferase (GGCT)/AIG2-like uncharacterized protein YtfP